MEIALVKIAHNIPRLLMHTDTLVHTKVEKSDNSPAMFNKNSIHK